MATARIRYELLVRTVVSEAMLATFHVPVSLTAVPRRTVYRFRVPADRDLSEVLSRLTERDVQVLEIRRCPELRPRHSGTAQVRPEALRQETVEGAATAVGVVVPFRGGARQVPIRRRAAARRASGGSAHGRRGRAAPADPRSCGADDAAPPLGLHAADAHNQELARPSPDPGAAGDRGQT